MPLADSSAQVHSAVLHSLHGSSNKWAQLAALAALHSSTRTRTRCETRLNSSDANNQGPGAHSSALGGCLVSLTDDSNNWIGQAAGLPLATCTRCSTERLLSLHLHALVPLDSLSR